MKAKLKPFFGTWIIVEMEAWDQDFVNMEVPGHFAFRKDGTGHFQFGLVQGEMEAWINDLPGDEGKAILKQLLSGQGQQAEQTLKSRFAAWRRGLRGNGDRAPRRLKESAWKGQDTNGGSRKSSNGRTRRVPTKPVQGFSQGVEVGSTDRRTGFRLSL